MSNFPRFPYLPSLWILIPGAIALAALVAWLYRRGAVGLQRRVPRPLLVLRMLAILLVLLCICDPVYRFHKSEKMKSVVALLVDDSASMAIRDVPDGRTRIESARRLLFGPTGKVARAIGAKFRVRTYAFAQRLRELRDPSSLQAEGRRTDFAACLTSLLAVLSGETLSGVIVCSDGADNGPDSVGPALRVFRENGIPIYTIGCGSRGGARDIRIERVSTHRRVSLETEVTAYVHVNSTGFAGTTVPLILSRGGVVQQQTVTLTDSPKRLEMRFKATEDGLLDYEVRIPPQRGELLEENNRQVFTVNASKHKLKVLYMEGTQYRQDDRRLWEFQYLVQALEEDKQIEVKPMLRDDVQAATKAGVPCVRDPDNGFPTTRKELFDYDVIICSDVDIVYFTEQQLKNIVDFVAEHGGAYIMIGGYTAFGPGGYDESIVDKMLPVDMQGRDDGYTEGVPFRWQITPEGWRHPIMQLDMDPKKNRDLWARMPLFRGFNHVLRAKPGATALAVHPDRKTLYGPNVILAVQPYGKGRTIAFVTDTTAGWGHDFEASWGEGADNRHFRKLWQNAVRWAAAYHLKVPNSPILIHADSNRYATGDRARLRAEVWDENFNPTHDLRVVLDIKAPDGKVSTMSMDPAIGIPGEYLAAMPLPAKGVYEVTARAHAPGKTTAPAGARDAEAAGARDAEAARAKDAEAAGAKDAGAADEVGSDVAIFTVGDPGYEYHSFNLNQPFLERLANETGGAHVSLDEAASLPDRLAEAAHLDETYVEKSWWDHPHLLALILALLGLEWFLRRRVGLP